MIPLPPSFVLSTGAIGGALTLILLLILTTAVIITMMYLFRRKRRKGKGIMYLAIVESAALKTLKFVKTTQKLFNLMH